MTKKNNESVDDYQYTEDNDGVSTEESILHDEADAPAPKKNRLGKLKNRKVIIVIGVIVVVIILYNLLSTHKETTFSASSSNNMMPQMTSKSKTLPIIPPAQFPPTTPEVKPVVKPAVKAAPALTRPAPVPAAAANTVSQEELNVIANNIAKDVRNTLNAEMEQFSATYDQRMNDMQHQHAKMAEQLEALRNRVTELRAQLTALQAQYQVVQSNQAVLASNQGYSFNASGVVVETAMTAAPSNNARRAANNAPQYTVQAVVPGRAWLSASDGSMVTVSVGDTVPGVGTVSAINSMNGTVTMDTGKVITAGE